MADLLPTTQRSLLHRVAVAQAEGRIPSLAAAVGRDRGPVWSAGRGAVTGARSSGDGAPTPDVQYRIGSITKTFVAVAVMRLRDAGALGLDDRLDEHVPGTPVGASTVSQLLSHTSGLATETPPPWWERTPGTLRPDLPSLLWDDPYRHPAGRRWHYSNTGYALLGALVERVRGRPWFDVVRDEILRPLEMRRTSLLPAPPHATGYSVHPWADVVLPEPPTDTGLMAPAGQLWSTTGDLVTFAALLLGGCDEVLSPATVAEMCEPASASADGRLSYGLGVMSLRTDDATVVGHLGSMPGFVAALWVEPAQRLAAVTLANTTSSAAFPTLATDLIRIVADAEPLVPEPWRPSPRMDARLLGLTGTWYRGPVAFHLRLLAGGDLELTSPQSPIPPVRLRAVSADAWLVWSAGYYNGEILTVGRDDAGTPTHLDLGSVVFTRLPYDPPDRTPGGVDDAWGA